MAADEITLKESSFGACGYAKRSPIQLTAETPAVNWECLDFCV